jgi:hypothetical protein
MLLRCCRGRFGWRYCRTLIENVSVHSQTRIARSKFRPHSCALDSISLGFEPEENEVTYLKRRLREEKAKSARAEKARREAESRCNAAEREKVVHRMLARRWHNRLNAMLASQQQLGQGENNAAVAMDMVDDVFAGAGLGGLAGLRLFLQQQLGEEDHHEEVEDSDGEEENEVQDMDHEMEDDAEEAEEQSSHEEPDGDLLEFIDDNDESESEDLIPIAEVETVPVAASLSADSLDNDSVMMEDIETSKRRACDQPRTVSISSADL